MNRNSTSLLQLPGRMACQSSHFLTTQLVSHQLQLVILNLNLNQLLNKSFRPELEPPELLWYLNKMEPHAQPQVHPKGQPSY